MAQILAIIIYNKRNKEIKNKEIKIHPILTPHIYTLIVIVVVDITNATYIHTYIHTYIQTYIQTYIHTYLLSGQGALHANASCPMKMVLLRETEADPINHSSIARVVIIGYVKEGSCTIIHTYIHTSGRY